MNRSFIISITTLVVLCCLQVSLFVSAQRLSTGQLGQLVSSAQLVRDINNDVHSTFKAQLYPDFAFAKNKMRSYPKKNSFTSSIQGRILTKALPVPKQYDLRQLFPECVVGIQNEGDCGSVWAMVPAATVSDRMCIQSNGKFQSILSTQYLLQCDTNDYGCNGGNLDTEFEFELKWGIPTEKCIPYSAQNGSVSSTCPTKCIDGSPLVLYKTKSVQNVTGEFEMQQAILQGGSVMSAIGMYADFKAYSSGIYQHSPKLTNPVEPYVLRIIGWGEENGIKYWIAPNNWGTSWGMKGYILIRRGINESNIEQNAYVFQVY